MDDARILEAIDDAQTQNPGRRPPTAQEIARLLGADDVAELETELEGLASKLIVWQTVAWWGDDHSSGVRNFAYSVRRGDPNDDLSGASLG